MIPLIGASCWATKGASGAAPGKFLFARYFDELRCKGNSAIATLNKWLTSRMPSGCVVHSFRHSFKYLLRAVECPSEIIDRLGGWFDKGVGETDGNDYP